MPAKYWGVVSAKLADFTVPTNCSGLNLPRAGSLEIFRGPAPLGCKVRLNHESTATPRTTSAALHIDLLHSRFMKLVLDSQPQTLHQLI